MIVKPVKTKKIPPGEQTIFEVLDEAIVELEEQCVVVVTSKIISLCEGSFVPVNDISKQALIQQESDQYLVYKKGKYPGINFSIKDHTLIPAAGIDESNAAGHFILWPKDSQKTASDIRKYLTEKFNLKQVGVVISDSTCMPMRWGTLGIALAYSGFKATNNYVGKPDLDGRPFAVSCAGIASGLSAAAVLTMGEGAEQTPIAVISDIPFVEFQDRDPTEEELKFFYIENIEDDLFAPFLTSVKWQKKPKQQPAEE